MSNQRYSPEFKDEAVHQIIEEGHSISEVAARLGVSDMLDSRFRIDPSCSVPTELIDGSMPRLCPVRND